MARLLRPIACVLLLSVALLPSLPHTSAATPIRMGAVFPLKSIGALARQEYLGVQIAQSMVNAAGGIAGRPITLDEQELDYSGQTGGIMRSLRKSGVSVVLGAYSSSLSIPAAQAAARNGMVYWEAGAVADRLTGQGLPTVFRVGASGSNLGSNSARFAAQQLSSRLHKRPSQLRVSVVWAKDAYATSVANAAIGQARSDGMRIVSRSSYEPYAPFWKPIMQGLKRAHPDILILASHIPDGVSFRRAMIATHLHVGAFIGSTMAECGPEFGAELGKQAVGVFASDRPMGGFNPRVLTGPARALYNRFASVWKKRTGQSEPSEEGLAGFSAAWALFHDVLPRANRRGRITTRTVTAAARALNLPSGSLPNGAGLRFATDRAHLGQNLRASAVIWQWQAVRHSVVVWPSQYSMGTIRFVPLPQ
jgi:branched-chain amino acid transport system substrate-binding protein